MVMKLKENKLLKRNHRDPEDNDKLKKQDKDPGNEDWKTDTHRGRGVTKIIKTSIGQPNSNCYTTNTCRTPQNSTLKVQIIVPQ